MSIVTDVISVTNDLGEGPIWYPEENALYWVDIGRAEVFRFRPETGEQNVCALDSVVSALGIWSEQKFVAATENGFSVLRTKDPGLARIDHFLEGEHGARLNDAKVGPGGRFWAGMLHESRKNGVLYCLCPDGSVREADIELVAPNGLDWAPGGETIYITDSRRGAIIEFDFDVSTGALSGRRIFAEVPEGEGVPDGLTVDANGSVWSVRFQGGSVVRYDPRGQVETSIDLPVACPTSCAFGGKHLDNLYVTSSRAHTPPSERTELDGSVLCLDTGVQGTKSFRYAS